MLYCRSAKEPKYAGQRQQLRNVYSSVNTAAIMYYKFNRPRLVQALADSGQLQLSGSCRAADPGSYGVFNVLYAQQSSNQYHI